MLRAALETLGRGYVIVDVPSAEEAQLEFRRGPVDLLITDLRLPGISGMELIRRLHKASSAARMIVISAYADETAQAEFRSLGATFFAKPLNLEAFLQGVQQALGGREPATATPSHEEQPTIAGRLARLRRDLGALVVALVGLDARIAVQAGEAPNLDLAAVLAPLMTAFSASLKVSQALGGPAPANVHFFDGTAYDMYSANVGLYFALVILFDGQRGPAQMGPVLRYGRQAADDLLNVLRQMGVEGGAYPPAPGAVAQPKRRVKTAPLRKKTAPLPPVVPASPSAGQAAPPAAAPDAPQPPPAPEPTVEKTTSPAATKYWDNVDGAEIDDERTDMLTWEQASKLGIFPPKSERK